MDRISREQRSAVMSRIRSENTGPEMRVRSELHRLGYRYRLYRRDLPGNPDLVFPSRKKIIFVHGCFWHRHTCYDGRKVPKSRKGYWIPKLQRNAQRDRVNKRRLRAKGWQAFVAWECQTRDAKLPRLMKRMIAFLESD